MGYFTLELARLVGETGRVVAVDLQPKVLDRLERRAAKAGLLAQLDVRVAKPGSLGIDDVTAADFALVFAVVHEVPEPDSFFSELAHALKQDGKLLFAEPKGHVKDKEFKDELQAAQRAGLMVIDRPVVKTATAALLTKY